MISSAKPDERAVITYVSSYYHTFAGAQKVINASNKNNFTLSPVDLNTILVWGYYIKFRKWVGGGLRSHFLKNLTIKQNL